MGFLSQVVAESRRSPIAILSGAAVNTAPAQGQLRDFAGTSENTVVAANARNSSTAPLQRTWPDSVDDVLSQSDLQPDKIAKQSHLRYTTPPHVDSISNNKVSHVNVQPGAAVMPSDRTTSTATKIEAANNKAAALRKTDATQSRQVSRERIGATQQQSVAPVVATATQSPDTIINASIITPTSVASGQTAAIHKTPAQQKIIQKSIDQIEMTMATSEAAVNAGGAIDTVSSTTVSAATANSNFFAFAIHGGTNATSVLTPSSLTNASAASSIQKKTASTQVRIGQVNVLVESTQPVAKIATDNRKQYDSDSRLFLRGL